MQSFTLWKQNDLINLLRDRMSDKRDERWTLQQKYRALNYALRELPVRSVAASYTLTFETGESTATLPDYIEGSITPQFKTTAETRWRDIARWRVEDAIDGTRTLVLGFIPTSSDSVRVVWYFGPGQVPEVETLPTLDAGITASDTSLVLDSSPRVGTVGFVSVGSEWIAYKGTSTDATNRTLLALERGIDGTTAAIHSGGDTVSFGVPFSSDAAMNYVIASAGVWMHGAFISGRHADMSDSNEIAVNLLREERDRAWKRISAIRSSKITLDPTGLL